MKSIKELSKNAGVLLQFYRHVSDPDSGKIRRSPDVDDSAEFGLPVASLADSGGIQLDKEALLRAHRELRARGLIEVRPKAAIKDGSKEYGEVYVIRHTYH